MVGQTLASAAGPPVVAALCTALILWVFLPARPGPSALTLLPGGETGRPTSVGWLGGDSAPTSIIREPMAVAVLPDGDILVADVGSSSIHRFSPDGLLRRSYGAGRLSYPVGLAVSEEGGVWVADLWQEAVFALDLATDRLDEVEAGPLGVRRPAGLAFKDGKLYVADVGRHQVLVMSPAGEILRVLGSGKGQGPGEMQFPNGVWASRLSDSVFVVDSNNRRIQVFDTGGHLLRTLQPHRLMLPRGLVEDAAGHLYVSDALAHDIVHLDEQGTALDRRGETEGLSAPNGLGLAGRRLFVADRGTGRIVIWDLGDA
ncbi:MAG: 6-bladed beta-propeller [Chloroflexota bacterium]